MCDSTSSQYGYFCDPRLGNTHICGSTRYENWSIEYFPLPCDRKTHISDNTNPSWGDPWSPGGPKELRCLHLLSLETLRSRTERGATITRPALQLPYSVLKTLGHSFDDLFQTLLLRDVKDQCDIWLPCLGLSQNAQSALR